MSCHTSRKVSYVLLAAALVLLWVGAETDALLPCLLALAVLAADLIQTVIFYRCPHCGRLLYMRKGPPVHCPHCGKELLSPEAQDRRDDW